MRVFRKVDKHPDGRRRTRQTWTVEARAPDGRALRVVGFQDKPASEALGRRVERLAACAAMREPPDADLTRWVEGLPARLRDRLVVLGVLDASRVAAAKPLDVHLSDFKAALLAKGCTVGHADLVTRRAARAFAGARTLSEITADRVRRFLADLLERGRSRQTHNFYRQAASQFCRWAVREGKMHVNPLVNVALLNVRTDRRHDRRALTVDECRRLLTATAGEPERFGMTGPERALVYRLALTTGLRRAELASLTRGSFRLDDKPPTVTVAAAYSKHRREDVLALRPDMADALRGYLMLKAPAAVAFNMPLKREAAPVFRADLEVAGIPYRDDSGQVADFHALRHTFITHLVRSGVHPKVAQVLARHSTITLTMDRYSHTILEDRTAALAALPDLGTPPEADAVRRTGTDGRPESGARSGAREGDFRRLSADLDERKTNLLPSGNTGEDHGEKAI